MSYVKTVSDQCKQSVQYFYVLMAYVKTVNDQCKQSVQYFYVLMAYVKTVSGHWRILSICGLNRELNKHEISILEVCKTPLK